MRWINQKGVSQELNKHLFYDIYHGIPHLGSLIENPVQRVILG